MKKLTINLLVLWVCLNFIGSEPVLADSEKKSSDEKGCVTAEITASSEQREYKAEMAMDSKMDTRWASNSSDDEQITIRLNSVKMVVGLKIHWETAYGRDYDIEILKPDNKWELISQVRYADGGLDEIYFGLRKIKGFRIKGQKRGTGWGYSIWEIELLGSENQIDIQASKTAENFEAGSAMDGKEDTFWQCPKTKQQEYIELTFPHKTGIGGVRINWAQDKSSSCLIQKFVEEQGKWETVMDKKAGFSDIEDLFFNSLSADKIRFVFPAERKNTVKIAEIQIKGGIDSWTPVRHYEMLAQRLKDGVFPRWLKREQGFWTVTGLINSFYESLLDEDGRIESGLSSFSSTAVLLTGNKIQTAKDFEVTQSLEKNWIPIPSVKWQGENLKFEITANTIKPDTTLVLYKLTNKSSKTCETSLMLAVRGLQLNPPWQHGGYSKITQAGWDKQDNTLTINNTRSITMYPEPDFVSLYSQDSYKQPTDIIEQLSNRKTAGEEEVQNENGIISAGMRYDITLKPSEEKFILAVYPNKKGANIDINGEYRSFFNHHLKKSVKKWQDTITGWDINVPDKRLVYLIRSNLAYLLINSDGPAVQPGSRNYDHSWIRDGAVSATAMLRFGLEDYALGYLQWFTKLITEDGFVPFLVDTQTGETVGFANTWKEYDAFGQYAYLVRQAVEITDNRELAENCWGKLKAAMQYMERLRQERLTAEYQGTEYEGILPESNSHEGYFPAKHSYWDDYFALRGLQDSQAIAMMLGHKKDAEWLENIENKLRKSLLNSIEMVRKRDNLEIIPSCAELGDFDPTSTAVAVMIANERENLPQDALEETYQRYVQGCIDRKNTPNKKRSGYTPYEVRNISALIRLGKTAQAKILLDFFVNDGVRPAGWNHLAEVVHGDYRTASYIGDMPHTWVGSGLINSIRDMFVYEENGCLMLAMGIPKQWLDKNISVKNLQTWWGPVSYNITKNNHGETILQLEYTQTPPNGFEVPQGIILEK